MSHSRQGETRRRQKADFEAASATAIYTIRAHGADSFCGCPCTSCCCTCCIGTPVTCEFDPNQLPVELSGVMSLSDYSNMINEIDEALKETLISQFPCMCFNLCLPLIPICYMIYCFSQRHRKVELIVEKYNPGLAEKGYYWEASPQTNVMYGFAFLRSNGGAAGRAAPVAMASHGQSGMDRGNAALYEMTPAAVVASPMKMEY